MSDEKKNVKRAWVLIFAVFFLVCCQPTNGANANSMKTERQEELVKLFDYEVQNRAFALISLQNLSKNEKDSVKKEFWDAYLALERLNQKKYLPFTSKFHISQEPRFMASFKASLIVMAYNWFPSYTWKSLYEATDKHIKKLEKMAGLAGEEDKGFFSYIVSQERVQLKAIMLMRNGKEQQAIELLSNFVVKHST